MTDVGSSSLLRVCRAVDLDVDLVLRFQVTPSKAAGLNPNAHVFHSKSPNTPPDVATDEWTEAAPGGVAPGAVVPDAVTPLVTPADGELTTQIFFLDIKNSKHVSYVTNFHEQMFPNGMLLSHLVFSE